MTCTVHGWCHYTRTYGQAWEIGAPWGGGGSLVATGCLWSSATSRWSGMARRHSIVATGSHGGAGMVASEANRRECFEGGLTGEKSRRRWDPIYGRRWSTPSSETLAKRCARVRRCFDQKESAGRAMERALTSESTTVVEALLLRHQGKEMMGEKATR
jgi:hypothetical protein